MQPTFPMTLIHRALLVRSPRRLRYRVQTTRSVSGRENITRPYIYICSASILCYLWFILLKGFPHILSQLSQFVLDLFFQQILTAHLICITLRTIGR